MQIARDNDFVRRSQSKYLLYLENIAHCLHTRAMAFARGVHTTIIVQQ